MDRLSREDFSRLIGALLGVSMGAALALAAACLIFPAPAEGFATTRYGVLEWVKPQGRHEEREMAFFFLTLVFGGTLGWVAASRYFGGRRPALFSLIFLAALVPAATLVIRAAMTSERLVAAVYAALAIIVLMAGIWLLRRLVGDALPTSKPANGLNGRASPVSINRMTISPVAAATICVLITAAFVIPLEATSIAAFIGFDMHMASFMIGPATYSFGKNLVPGIDYFTQYSVGTPWLFSFFLAPTATATMVNAVWFVVAEILIFQLSLLFFLRWFLRSWSWALVVGLACLMLQFGTSSPLYAPSSTSARYPLLIICVISFVHWVRRDFTWPAALLLAAALASAIFLNTETGIYICAAAAIVAVIMGPGFVVPVVRTVALGAATLVLFLVWNVIAFGPGVLQIQYLLLLLEPLMLYTGGLIAWPIEWLGGYHWIYNIVSPAIALASVAWVAASVRLEKPPCPRPHLAALAMVALVGLFMTAKYINMSIVGLWQVNAVCLLVVVAWWMRALIDQLPQQRSGAARFPFRIGSREVTLHRGSPRTEAAFGLALLLLLFLCTITDPRNPSLYAIPAYRTHPTVVNYVLGGPERYPCGGRTGCTATPVSPLDVELVDRLTKPTERIALLAFQDWTTLIEARRASKFHFLPSAVVFTERQLRDSLRDIDLILLPRYPADTLGITNPDMAQSLLPMLRSNFKVVAETPTLLAWRRTGSDAGSDSTGSNKP
jgi:hypothetical protein